MWRSVKKTSEHEFKAYFFPEGIDNKEQIKTFAVGAIWLNWCVNPSVNQSVRPVDGEMTKPSFWQTFMSLTHLFGHLLLAKFPWLLELSDLLLLLHLHGLHGEVLLFGVQLVQLRLEPRALRPQLVLPLTRRRVLLTWSVVEKKLAAILSALHSCTCNAKGPFPFNSICDFIYYQEHDIKIVMVENPRDIMVYISPVSRAFLFLLSHSHYHLLAPFFLSFLPHLTEAGLFI